MRGLEIRLKEMANRDFDYKILLDIVLSSEKRPHSLERLNSTYCTNVAP